MSMFYLIALLVSLGCLALIDWRYKLAFWHDAARTFKVFVVSLAVFLVWDVAGIVFDVFYIGPSEFVTGIVLAPELPIEEMFFLSLLTYTALLVWRKQTA